MRFSMISLGAIALAAATPAWAQSDPAPVQSDPVPSQDNSPTTQGAGPSAASETAPPKAITVTGGVTLVSNYRFRGLTQGDRQGAAQGTITVASSVGFYGTVWASTIDGSGRTPALNGYGDAEVDLSAGFTKTVSGFGVDAGVLYYYYPSGRDGLNTDFFEPYASVGYTVGPVAAKLGAAYAWGGQKGLDFRPGNKDDNLYAYGEASLGIPKTPVSLKGHLGYSNGSLGLANPTLADDDYWDWSVTAEAVGGPLKVGVSYVDTDISQARGFYNRGGYAPQRMNKFADFYGRGRTVLAYVGVSF